MGRPRQRYKQGQRQRELESETETDTERASGPKAPACPRKTEHRVLHLDAPRLGFKPRLAAAWLWPQEVTFTPSSHFLFLQGHQLHSQGPPHETSLTYLPNASSPKSDSEDQGFTFELGVTTQLIARGGIRKEVRLTRPQITVA